MDFNIDVYIEECLKMDKIIGTDEMRKLLETDVCKALVQQIMMETNGALHQLAVASIETQEGQLTALRTQGMITGMRRFMDIIAEIINPELEGIQDDADTTS